MRRIASLIHATFLFGLVAGSFPKVGTVDDRATSQKSHSALRQQRLHDDGKAPAPAPSLRETTDEARNAPSGRLRSLLRTPGLVVGIFGMLLVIGAVACVKAWNYAFPGDKDAGAGVMTCKQFQDLADKSELDFYTCMALSIGRERTVKAAIRFLPRLLMLLCMQVLLVVLLLVYQTDHQFFPPVQQGQVYRVIGGMLFAYSALNLHASMNDECRENIVHMMLNRQASGWYLWPILLGESVNTFVAVFLMGILFLIFCDCSRPQELLINCIAINFVADVDNKLVSPDDVKQGVDDFRVFHGAWEGSRHASQVVRESSALIHRSISHALGQAAPAEEHSSVLEILQTGVLHINRVIRCLVPIVAGILTFLFVFANNQPVCQQMRAVDPWPFCLELSV